MLFYLILVLLTMWFLVATFASIYTNSSNYLDSNINAKLDVMKDLGLPMAKDETERVQFNNLLLPKLSLATKYEIIDIYKKKNIRETIEK